MITHAFVRNFGLVFAAIVASACTPQSPPEDLSEEANFVFVNGAIYTVDHETPWASAIAIAGTDIVYVGDAAGAAKYVGEHTRQVDLEGKMMLPGFHDTHVHPVPGGMNLTIRCNLSGLHSIDRIQAKLAQCSEDLPDGEWLNGSGWSTGSFPNGNPMKEALDAVPGNHPIYLSDEGGHSGWANSLALELAGINSDTVDPPAGIIMRDADGNPSGTLREHAMSLVKDLVPEPSREEKLAALVAAMKHANEFGITSMVDAMVGTGGEELYRYLDDQNQLSVRFNLAYYLKPDWDGDIDSLVDRLKADSDMLRGTQIKLWMDGVMEAQTAFVKTAYVDQPDNYGIQSYSDEFTLRWIPELEARGFQMHLHTIGDAAVSQALDALEKSREQNGKANTRPYLIHNYLIDREDYKRIMAADATVNFTMLWDQMDPVMVNATKPYVSHEQFVNFMPMGQTHDFGLVVTGGSDWPVSQISPLTSIEVAVTGGAVPYHLGMPTEIDQAVMVGERVDLKTMIEAYTINAAYASLQDDIIGSISVGKRADLIVLDANLFEIPLADINETKVLMTLVNGEIVYESDR